MSAELKRALGAREPLVGNWIAIGNPVVAELCATPPFDLVVIDLEHQPTDFETLQGMVRAVETAEGDTEAVVRIPDDDPATIKRALDTGVAGIQVPMVDTAEQAEAIVSAARYPPEGIRGTSPSRASTYFFGFEEYYRRANDEVVVMIQIETERGLENAGDIAAVEGVDALFVGPSDLSASLGMFGEWDGEYIRNAMRDVVAAAHEVDVPVSTIARGEAVTQRAELGFDFLFTGSDLVALGNGSQQAIADFEAAMGPRSNRST